MRAALWLISLFPGLQGCIRVTALLSQLGQRHPGRSGQRRWQTQRNSQLQILLGLAPQLLLVTSQTREVQHLYVTGSSLQALLETQKPLSRFLNRSTGQSLQQHLDEPLGLPAADVIWRGHPTRPYRQ